MKLSPLPPLPPVFNSFLSALETNYSQFKFYPSSRFRFHPPKTIYYELPILPISNQDIPLQFQSFAMQLLHELGHALSNHNSYQLSIDRLKKETEAWQSAKKVFALHPEWTKKYPFHYEQNFVELHLDTYRHWLHQKSVCKNCGLTRFQNQSGQWICPRCHLLSQ